jgi:hypothetical protein
MQFSATGLTPILFWWYFSIRVKEGHMTTVEVYAFVMHESILGLLDDEISQEMHCELIRGASDAELEDIARFHVNAFPGWSDVITELDHLRDRRQLYQLREERSLEDMLGVA